MGFVEEPVYAQLARIGKAVSSPVRLRLLDLLDQHELSVEQLAEEAGVGLKNTSAQLQHLRAAHLITARKDGNRVLYRLADPDVSVFLGHLQDFAAGRLADLRDAVADLLGEPGEWQPVTAEELRGRLEDVVVVDVRSPAAYAEWHIPGAISIPGSKIVDRIDELPKGRDIVAYCSGPYCVASPKAVRQLRDHGRRARTLAGGATRWRRSGQPVEA
ncbi:ArsR/SmtB family transcription factor [Fodinicola acaciae]|uniref:ArsR/SmtB family transcription factor n=1 Tax=Fodinicola acaciae TaxID=2681555 RepID=UPI0013D34EE4|nr:metalloregulator ArsR/SmtB family transcription factor [Fodinicola acaciae]